MATASLIHPISLLQRESRTQYPKWNSHLQSFPIRQPMIFDTSLSTKSSKFSRPPKAIISCATKRSRNDDAKDPNPNENMFVGLISEALKSLQKPTIAAVALGLMLTCAPHLASAASGGRMGGSSFLSRSSSSGRSYSSGSSSSYSSDKSYWSGSSSSYKSPSSSSSSSSPSYSSSSSRPSYSSSSSKPSSSSSSSSESHWTSMISPGSSKPVMDAKLFPSWSRRGILVCGSIGVVVSVLVWVIICPKTSVLMVQVGLLGTARSFQKDLDRIAETADTSSSEGLSYILKETIFALLRHPDCCVSCYSSLDVKFSMEDGEKCFNQLSTEEQAKFNEVTLSNVNNIKRRSTRNKTSSGFSNEYIVITILVAAEGVHPLPAINSSGDLKKALQKLSSIPSHITMAVEVLWTPQQENDRLSVQELLEDYSLLRPL